MLNLKLNSLAGRLSIWIGLCVTLIFVIALSANYYLSRQLLESYASKLAISTIESTVQNINGVLETVINSADTLAAYASGKDIDTDTLRRSIPPFISANPSVYGMTIALKPGIEGVAPGGFSPYYYRNSDQLAYSDLTDENYRYQEWDWYRNTMQSGQAGWSEPYLDVGGGNTQMTTYSTPITRNNEIIGVATADVQLSWLHALVKEIRLGETGYGFIVSANDVIVSHPDARFHMMNLLDMLNQHTVPENWQKYLESKSRTEPVYLYTDCRNIDGNCWVAIESLGNTGWKVFIVLPEAELISDIRLLTIKIAAIALLGLAVLLITVSHVTKRLTQPLGMLASATRDIGRGELDIDLPATKYQDEISMLTDDFDHMRTSLKNYIEEVRAATASKQKLESEIEIARDIQMSMIPGSGKSSLSMDRLAVYAYCRPARSVGGDLYYYQADDDLFRFIIGDVSDKGVPAALFMAKTVTLFTRALRDELSPGQTLSMMNDILSENNDACMFVTALCGAFQPSTGKLVMANAGHMNPIIHHDNSSHEIDIDGATALGLMDGIDYPDIEHQVQTGDIMLMYTDGISEAHDTADQQYGDARILDLVNNINEPDPETLGNSLLADVDSFASETEQFDDMTLLIIRYDS